MIYESIYNKLIVFKKNYFEKKIEEAEFDINNKIFKEKITKSSYVTFGLNVFFVSTVSCLVYLCKKEMFSLYDGVFGLMVSSMSIIYLYQFILFRKIKKEIKIKLQQELKKQKSEEMKYIGPIRDVLKKIRNDYYNGLFLKNYKGIVDKDFEYSLKTEEMKEFLSKLSKDEIVKIIDILEKNMNTNSKEFNYDVIIEIEKLCQSKINFSECVKEITTEELHDDLMLAIINECNKKEVPILLKKLM